MCACRPNVRTPNCGSVACIAAARKSALAPALAFMRAEAARFRARDEGADAAVAAHVEILADRIERGDLGRASPQGAGRESR